MSVKSNLTKEVKNQIIKSADSMLHRIHNRDANKDENIKVKKQKYPGASLIDILDHIKRSLRKAHEQTIVHAGVNDISNDTNYLKNVKKVVKLVKETCKDARISFSSVICYTNIKDISDIKHANTTNPDLECLLKTTKFRIY